MSWDQIDLDSQEPSRRPIKLLPVRPVPTVDAYTREQLEAGAQLVYALYHTKDEHTQHFIELISGSHGLRVAYDRAVKAHGIQHSDRRDDHS